jgi:transcriptional regulator with XRE-family HTH domain
MRRLRAARNAAALTREEVVEKLDWSLSKLVRIETGDQGVAVTDLRAMLALYKVTDEETIKDLVKLARSSRRLAWWNAYRDVVSKQYGQLLGFEGSASCVRSFHPLLIPGLLHTTGYGFELRRVLMSDEKARKLTDLLRVRQERLFDQPAPPEMEFIFGEEALLRPIGGAVVMRQQFHHLLEAITSNAASIRIVPLSVGAHVGVIGPFNLVGLRDSDDEALFIEGGVGDVANRDDQKMITTFTEHFESLQELALPKDQTSALINHRIDQMSQS